MWSFKDAIKYLLNTFHSFYKIQEGVTAFNKDIIGDLKDVLTHKGPKNMSVGVHDVMTGNGLLFWLSAISTVLTFVLNSFYGVFAFSFITSLLISGLINAFVMQIMYNHRQSWSGILYKVYTILVVIALIFEIISVVTGVLGMLGSLSPQSIINILATITRILAYGMVINGLTV